MHTTKFHDAVSRETGAEITETDFCPTRFPERNFEITRRGDGSLILTNRHPLVVRQPHFPAYLRHHAECRPDTLWLAQRSPGGGAWQNISFGTASRIIDALTQGLLDLGLKPGDPLAILSGNSLEHALITMAALQAHLPVMPISPAYALQSGDHGRLRELLAMVPPRAIFVQDAVAFSPAIDGAGLGDLPIIAVENTDCRAGSHAYHTLATRKASHQVAALRDRIDGHAIAKFMFTSGSTGSPKAVPQTHRNLCVAGEAILTSFGELDEGNSVRLDWAPWSHVFGATNVTLALMSGSTLYIDDGRPTGPLVQETLRNLREISPTTYANVPAGYAAILGELEKDDQLAANFFRRLWMLGYAAAALPEDIALRLQRLAIRHRGHKIPITSGYGATETCPAGASVFWATDRMGLIGLPQPGYEMKLIPIDAERFEVRFRGEAVISGFHGRPELNNEIFDEEGFYKIGDAAAFADPAAPLEGLRFAGRLTEEFKLQTGTFVRTGPLRMAILDAAAPLLKDVVICGENQPYLTIMAWLDENAAVAIAGDSQWTLPLLNRNPKIRAHVAAAIGAHNQNAPGSSTRIVRILLLDEPPSIAHSEVTDKGSINQRAVQRNRPLLVQKLFAEPVLDDATFAPEPSQQ